MSDGLAAAAYAKAAAAVKNKGLLTDWWAASGDKVMAHRGGGTKLAPDQSLNAMRFAAARGLSNVLIDGGDVRRLSDGTFVVMHDTTLDRTTTSTGNVSARSGQSWRGIVIDPTDSGNNPILPGWPTENAPFLSQVLDEFGHKAPMQLELKSPTATDMQAMVDLIKARGCQRNVMVAQFVRSDADATAFAPALADPEITCCVIAASPAERTAAQHIATGALYLAYDVTAFAASVSGASTYLTALVAGGMRIGPYVTDRRTEWAAEKARGATWITSDDPYYVTASILPQTADQLAAGSWTDGWIPSITQAGSLTQRPKLLTGGLIQFGTQGDDGAGGDVTSTSGHWVCPGQLCQNSQFSQLTFTVRNDQGTDATRWAGVILGCTDDSNRYVGSNFTIPATGYFVGIRANGGVFISKLDGVGGSTSLGTATGTAIAVGTSSTFTIVVTGTTIAIKQGATTLLTVTDSAYRGGFFHLGKTTNTNTGAGLEKFSDSTITVTP